MASKWYQDDKGNVSTMRILSMCSGIIGLLISLAGTVAMFLNNPTASTALNIGMAMVGLALGTKSAQKFAER